jgi:hypothetical protein
LGTLFIYLDTIVPLCIFVIAVLFLYVKKIFPNFTDRVILTFLLLQVCLNALSTHLQNNQVNNHWVYHLNCLLTQFLFAWRYYRALDLPIRKRLVIGGTMVFLVFYVLNLLFFQPYNTFNSSYALSALIIVWYAYMGLQMLINNLPAENILHLKIFWFAAGILLYFGSSFFIFISYHYLSIVSAKNVGILWKIHNVFLAVGCILFLKAITSKEWTPK